MGLKLNAEGKETPYIQLPNFFFFFFSETYDLLQSKMLELDKMHSPGVCREECEKTFE